MDNNKEDIILDYIDNITFNRNTFPIKNLHALDYTRDGLYELASLIRTRENSLNTTIGHYMPYFAGGSDENHNKLMN